MGRRRRRVIKVYKKTLPKVFDCPVCGETSIRVSTSKNGKIAVIQCGSCGLREELTAPTSFEPIDIYCMFIDSKNKMVAQRSEASTP